MSLFKIAWRSIQQRGLASSLTMLSMALGVMMVVAVLSIHGVVTSSFRNNSSLGYNLIVGAKGGKLQLTLNTVYYLSQPVENVSYDYYLEFADADQRQREVRRSIRYQVHEAEWEAIETSLLAANAVAGLGELGSALAGPLLERAAREQGEFDREGKYGPFTALAVPLCLGDYYGRFRAVGTTPEFFDQLTFGAAGDRQYEFAAGRNFEEWNAEHGYFEAVVGATVAREKGVRLGDEISPAHGDPDVEGHAQHFTVVGILKPTGTPNDRAVFINMEGFFLMEGHAKPLEREEEAPADAVSQAPVAAEATVHSDSAVARPEPLPLEEREVTSILLRTINPVVAVGLPNTINEGADAQCVAPIRQINNLFVSIVGPIQTLLLILTVLICIVSGISILVSIYNSMSDRKHEIAVMRALGANRETVMTVILLESILISLAGGLGGWVGAHALNWLASGEIEQRTGVQMGFFSFTATEWLLVPALIALAVIVGLLPAMAAYRTDVAESLGS